MQEFNLSGYIPIEKSTIALNWYRAGATDREEGNTDLEAIKTKEEWVEIDTVFDLNANVTKERLSIIKDLDQINFNGFTVPLIATASVVPCETYHIKLAIADVSDGALNSGVFLAENSFSSIGISVDQGSDYAPFIGNDSTLVEGCMNGEIIFELTDVINTNSVIDYVVSGTAENGVDYEDIGNQVIIPAGETQVIIPIVPIYDGVTEGMEELVVTTTISDGPASKSMPTFPYNCSKSSTVYVIFLFALKHIENTSSLPKVFSQYSSTTIGLPIKAYRSPSSLLGSSPIIYFSMLPILVSAPFPSG